MMLMGTYPKTGLSQQTKKERNFSDSDQRCIFSDNNNEEVKQLSKFNKKKWLPLCIELPARISAYCCNVMKKSPLGIYERTNHVKPYLGTMAEESSVRKQAWFRRGCNAFDGDKPSSQPLSFWTDQDILQYVDSFKLDYAAVYGGIIADHNGKYYTSGVQRSGCIFCAFGAHMEDESRFERLKVTHPKHYDYCVGGGQWIPNPDFDPSYDGAPNEFGWVDWNPERIWVPSRDGLGYAKLFDMANAIMEKEGYKTMWRY